ncbi:unnamed protein product [Calypogeia fissa]
MEVRTLELNIISAQGLKKVSTFGHDTCYAVAYIYSNDTKATGVDRDGGENPSWNSKVTLTCDDKLLRKGSRSHITVEIYSYGSVSNKLVGTAAISLLDVGKQQAGQPQFMAYEVRRPSGKVRGVLNVSVKVGEKQTVNHSGQAYSGPSSVDSKQRNPKVPQVQDVSSLTGYTQTYPPVQSYPPPNWSTQGGTSTATAPYPPTANNGVSVYPPPKSSSEARGREDGSNAGVVVYPPPKPEGDSSSTSISGSDSKDEEPVMAYPAYTPPPQYGQDYGQQFYGAPQYYGAEYVTGPQGYYYPGAQPAYGYQQQQYQYSEPHRRHHGGPGVGFLGAALGGLLVGDLIGNIF